MADALKLEQKYAVKLEVTEGVEPVFTDADYIEVNADGTAMDLTVEKLERSVLRGSKLPADFRFGPKNASGSVSVEFGPSEVAGGAPHYSILLESGGFRKDAFATRVLLADSTTTVLNVASTTGILPGHVIKIKVAGNHQWGIVESVEVDESITLKEAIAVAPAAGVSIAAASQMVWDEAVSKTVSMLREQGGGLLQDVILGGRVGTIAMENGTTGGVPNLNFGLTGLDYVKRLLEDPSGSNPAFDNLPGALLLGAKLFKNGEEFCASELGFSIEQSLATKSCMTKANGKVGTRGTNLIGSGTVTAYKPNDEIAWDTDGQIYSLLLIFGNPLSAGETQNDIAIYFPKCKNISVTEGDAEGSVTDQIAFEIVAESAADVPVIAYVD